MCRIIVHERHRTPHKGKAAAARCCQRRMDAKLGEHDRNYYTLLGVSIDPTSQQIKEAYRKLQKKYHPDIAGQKVIIFWPHDFISIQSSFVLLCSSSQPAPSCLHPTLISLLVLVLASNSITCSTRTVLPAHLKYYYLYFVSGS